MRLADLLVLATVAAVARASELYFYLTESEPLCFFDDLALGSTILVKFEHVDHASKPAVVRIYDPNGATVVEKRATETGRLAFAAKQVGEHRVCAAAELKTKAWPASSKTARFSMRVDVVSGAAENAAEDTINLAKVAHVKGLEAELNDLANVVDLVLQDMELARQRETHFREQSERISSRVVWWSVIQTLVLVAAGVMQSLHLQRFFMSKKIA